MFFGRCPCGSGVEHTLGKGEVVSSSLTMGSKLVNGLGSNEFKIMRRIAASKRLKIKYTQEDMSNG